LTGIGIAIKLLLRNKIVMMPRQSFFELGEGLYVNWLQDAGIFTGKSGIMPQLRISAVEDQFSRNAYYGTACYDF